MEEKMLEEKVKKVLLVLEEGIYKHSIEKAFEEANIPFLIFNTWKSIGDFVNEGAEVVLISTLSIPVGDELEVFVREAKKNFHSKMIFIGFGGKKEKYEYYWKKI